MLSSPDEAAHVLGKLLGRVGEDRVLWGTDAIWYGSPQPQIMAFRAFEITPEFQARYGYRPLTADLGPKPFASQGCHHQSHSVDVSEPHVFEGNSAASPPKTIRGVFEERGGGT